MIYILAILFFKQYVDDEEEVLAQPETCSCLSSVFADRRLFLWKRSGLTKVVQQSLHLHCAIGKLIDTNDDTGGWGSPQKWAAEETHCIQDVRRKQAVWENNFQQHVNWACTQWPQKEECLNSSWTLWVSCGRWIWDWGKSMTLSNYISVTFKATCHHLYKGLYLVDNEWSWDSLHKVTG